MNIFYLDENPFWAASYQCDKHVVKMILESAQMLSTVRGGPYKPTHAKHPCTLWVQDGAENYRWLWRHAVGLCGEYRNRYRKVHACEKVILDLFQPPANLISRFTPPAQAMPEKYKDPDPVKAYRQYYLGEKMGFASWKHGAPEWVRYGRVV